MLPVSSSHTCKLKHTHAHAHAHTNAPSYSLSSSVCMCMCVCVYVCFTFLVASLFSFLPLFLFFVGMFDRQKEVVSSSRKLARQSNAPPTSQSRGMGIPAIVRSYGGLSQSLWQDFQGGTEHSQSIRLQGHPGKRERKKGKWERKKK